MQDLVLEYRYCKLFPATTAEAFAGMPASRVLMMLRIHDVFERVDAERRRKAADG